MSFSGAVRGALTVATFIAATSAGAQAQADPQQQAPQEKSQAASQITQSGPDFPMPSPGFKPKGIYDLDAGRAWRIATLAINENQIPIESASKDANQIVTGFRPGPMQGNGIFFGALATQYRFTVSLIPVSATQTQLKIGVELQARRDAARVAKVLSGNNAISDQRWNDVTKDNPAAISALQNWLYEQFEQREASAMPAVALEPAATSASRPVAGSTRNIEQELQKIESLRKKKLITDAEYRAMRAKALGL